MKTIKQLSINSSARQSKFTRPMVLGPLIGMTLMLFHSLGFSAAPLRIQGEVTKHSTLAVPLQKTAAVFV
ncbi:MAG: hypothetical protein K2X47_11220, partial [Bdellovibrionales bacterium]|nr:hypothetical protein [Bdellovibrionales bacterium]